MGSLFALTLAVSCIYALAGRGSGCPDGNLTIHVGQPFIMDFGYKGFTLLSYTKDGSPFRADNVRVFITGGKISFTNVRESDGGVYELNVENFRSRMCLTG